jgi:tetratricopeptide (TPR) repeat protein
LNIRDLIPVGSELKQLRDVESSLLRRKRTGNSAGIVAALAAGLQIALLLSNKNYLDQIGRIVYSLVRFRFREFATLGIGRYQAIGWLVVFLAAVTYLLLRRTTLLLKESKEPFRYTFWIQPFTLVADTPRARCKLQGDDRFQLLHHDLAERLAQRIRRFSILEEPAEGEADSDKAVWLGRQSSHIHVSGSVAIREERDSEWVLHVMPLIRMGSSQSPSTLAPSVKYPLEFDDPPLAGKHADSKTKTRSLVIELAADEYNQMVERVYSRVATEVYAQIELDVRNKINLFPTAYMRAVALYHEAEDFARSNTIDAYDRAIALYRDALRYFELMPAKWLHSFLLIMPLLWRLEVRFQHRRARVVTGYTKCLIYKNRMSALSGRDSNPLFELPELLATVMPNVERLHTKLGRSSSVGRRDFLLADVLYPKDSWFNKRFGRSYTPRFEVQKKTQFELYIVEALVHFFLGSRQEANKRLERAQATAADKVARDPLYLLARGLVEPVTEKRIPYFRQAVDNEPNFQIAQWFLAEAYEKEFRLRDEINEKRALSVIKEYDEVLKINYGNIAALAAQGHLLWLISDPMAQRKFNEGREIKAIARETFVGQLNYSLARIAAEAGDYEECRNRYTEAVGADPTLGAYVVSAGSRSSRTDYDDIGPEMLQRFRRYKENVEESLKKLLAAPPKGHSENDHPSFTEKTLRVVHGFVLNDYANACLRYFHHHGSPEQLLRAIRAYEKATQVNPTDALPWFNLQNAYGWEGEYVKAADCFPRARELAPGWSRVAIDAARERVANAMKEIRDETKKIADAEEKLAKLKQETGALATTKAILESKDALTLLGDQLKERDDIRQRVSWSSPAQAALQRQASSDPQAELQAEIEELNAKEKRLTADQEVVNKEMAVSKRELDELAIKFRESMDSGLKEIKENSRLAALFEGALKEQIDRLIAIPWRKLDNSDVETLIALAQILAGGDVDQPEYLTATQRLAEHLLEMYPEDSRVVELLQNVVPKLIAVIQKEIELAEKASFTSHAPKLLRDAVANLVGRLIEPPPKVESFNPRVAALWRRTITKLIAALEKSLEPPTTKSSLSRRAMKRQIDHLNDLLQASTSRWKTIVDYWMQTDSRTFLALYWYVPVDPTVDRQSLDQVMETYFKRDKDVFENLLGHVYFRLDRFDEAITAYKKAISLNGTLASYHFSLGRALNILGRGDEARAALYRAHHLDPEQREYGESLAFVYNARGIKHYDAREYPDAIDNFLQAISLLSYSAIFHFNLASAWERNKGVPELVALQKAIDAMQAAQRLAPHASEYKNDLARLHTRRTMIDLYGQEEMKERTMSVTRVRVKCADNLSDLILEKGQQNFLTSVRDRITELRENIRESFGVEIPALRWNINPSVPNDRYYIVIDEVPLVLSTVYRDKKLCLQIDQLAAQGLVGEASQDPETGAAALWLQQTDWDKATAAGLTLLDAVDVIFRHLKRVMIEHLAEFLGFPEVINLLKGSEKSEVAALAKDYDAVTTLTMVLRGLLAEEVPIEAFKEICNYFLSVYGEKTVAEMIEEVRMLPPVRKRLPGNSKDFTVKPLDEKLAKLLKDSLVAIDFAPNGKDLGKTMKVLAVPPEEVLHALDSIRSVVTETPQATLVVGEPELRNPLRKLVELEFPRLPVLSQREMLADVTADSSETAEVKAAPVPGQENKESPVT